MKELIEFIEKNCTKDIQDIEDCVEAMICDENSPIPLTGTDLLNALKIDGEFLVLNLNYDDFQNELKYEKIKYKISQALSVIVRYEDDGNSFENIETFVKYIDEISDDKQNSTFGIKKVKKLSQFPITILFSGILPINQLKMTVGSKIYDLIHSDDDYFIPRLKKFRDDISKEIKIPLLPVFPILDEKLGEFKVSLVDLYDGRLISEFEVCQNVDKNTIEIYLLKLFYIYKVLSEDT